MGLSITSGIARPVCANKQARDDRQRHRVDDGVAKRTQHGARHRAFLFAADHRVLPRDGQFEHERGTGHEHQRVQRDEREQHHHARFAISEPTSAMPIITVLL
jgi:hypothetical protein